MMIMNRRRVMGGGGGSLPYDSEIEYLETQGGCEIPTDFVPNTYDLTFKGKMYYGGYTDNAQYAPWWTAYTAEDRSAYRIIRQASFTNLVILNHGTRAYAGGTAFSVTLNTIYTFEFTPTQYKINDSVINHISSGEVNEGVLSIFSNKFIGKLYYFQVYKNDALIHDYVPVRVGSVGYLYDKVSGQLFGNQGTGAFVLGPDV